MTSIYSVKWAKAAEVDGIASKAGLCLAYLCALQNPLTLGFPTIFQAAQIFAFLAAAALRIVQQPCSSRRAVATTQRKHFFWRGPPKVTASLRTRFTQAVFLQAKL